MLKLFGAILTFGSCAAIGLSARETLRRRVKADEAMLLALSILIRELKNNRTPLREVFASLAENNNATIRAFYGAVLDAWQENEQLSLRYHWCKIAQKNGETLGLGDEEIKLLCEMANFLGRYDAAEQCKGLEQIAQRLEAMRETARDELYSKGNLYRTCGIAVGIVVILILI